MKICTKCNQTKELSEFGIKTQKRPSGKTYTYPRSRCNDCTREDNRIRIMKPENKQKRQQASYKNRLKKYGLSETDYKEMQLKQDNACLICEEIVKLHVDHCHSGGQVRGLLCGRCNTGLGFFTDSIPKLKGAIRYLEANGVKDESLGR